MIRFRKRFAFACGGGVAVGLLVGAAVLALDPWGTRDPPRTSSGVITTSASDEVCYFSVDQLVAGSPRIIVATLLDERTEDIGLISPVTGKVHDTRTDVVRRFRVDGTLKGDTREGDVQEARSTWVVRVAAFEAVPGRELEFDVPPMVLGERYALFLGEGTEQDGSLIWGATGEPGVATIGKDGKLDFILSDEYVESMKAYGLVSGNQRVPFTATLDEIKAEIARQAAALPPTPVVERTPAASPTPGKPVPATP